MLRRAAGLLHDNAPIGDVVGRDAVDGDLQLLQARLVHRLDAGLRHPEAGHRPDWPFI